MLKRKIVTIDEEKCNGCGLCVTACHEGAIEIVNGKARLVGEEYCDGLGDCLPACPTDAIKIVEKEAKPFSEEAVERRKLEMKKDEKMLCGCPSTFSRKIERDTNNSNITRPALKSELNQWPIQLMLVNPRAEFLKEANLLVAADCTAYAYANFHQDFIKNHVTVIGCPKLDNNQYYQEKLAEIVKNNNIKSITVVRMEVPCCTGIVNAVRNAVLNTEIPVKEVVVSINGEIKK